MALRWTRIWCVRPVWIATWASVTAGCRCSARTIRVTASRLRRALADLSPVEAAQFLLDKITKTPSNAAFLGAIVAPAPVRKFR